MSIFHLPCSFVISERKRQRPITLPIIEPLSPPPPPQELSSSGHRRRSEQRPYSILPSSPLLLSPLSLLISPTAQIALSLSAAAAHAPRAAPPAADRIICLAVAVWSAVSSLWFDPPDYSCPLHSIDRQPNPT